MLQCDDELYRLDRVWLGPKGKPWPIRETYRMYVCWVGLTLGLAVVYRMIGLPWHWLGLVVLGTVGYLGAKWLDRRLTPDRPVWAEVARIWTELSAPRPEPPQVVTYSVESHVERWGMSAPPRPHLLARVKARISAVTHRKSGKTYVNGKWEYVS